MFVYTIWTIIVLLAGYYDWGIWFAIPAIFAIAYLKRGWYKNNGVGPARAVIIGMIFASPGTVGIYYFGYWLATLKRADIF